VCSPERYHAYAGELINSHHDFAAVAGLAVNNRITGADIGIDFSSATGKYRDHLTFDVGTPYVGGTNAGNNN
jgi:hypothetical protein